MLMPCPNKISCPGSDDPIANLSSERADRLVFIGYNFGWNWNILPLGGSGPGHNPGGSCDSPVSQAEADLCAADCQVRGDCAGGGDGDDPQPKPKDPDGNPIQNYHNHTECCIAQCPDGSQFSQCFGAGQISNTSQVIADRIAASYACQLAQTRRLCIGTLREACCSGAPYVSRPSSTQRISDVSVVSGMMPPGLFLQEDINQTVLVAGTPTTPGTYTFTLRFTDTDGSSVTKSFTITVLGITNGDPTDATQGTAYSFQFTAAGGTPPYTFALEAGPLPAGITLDDNGLLSGTPTEDGDFNITVSVTDSAP
jgi:hypothetical protein